MLRFLSRELHAWRFMHASSNRLVRPVDRLESALLLIVSLLSLAGLLIALTVGGDTSAARKASLDDQAPRYPVSAKVIGPPNRDDDRTAVAWNDSDGHRVTAAVDHEPLDRVGRTRQIWLDDSGAVADPPATTSDAVLQGIGTGCGVALVTALSWWGLTLTVRTFADRHRARMWDRQWRELDLGSHH